MPTPERFAIELGQRVLVTAGAAGIGRAILAAAMSGMYVSASRKSVGTAQESSPIERRPADR